MPPTISPQVTPYYGGGQVVNPANVIQTSGAPSTKLIEQGLGTIAVDNAAQNAYVLVSKTGGTATWFLFGGASSGIAQINGDSGHASPSGGAVTITGASTGITFSGSGSTLTFGGTLGVANGGTGATTLTSHGVLVGSGTSAIAALTVGTNGQVLLGSTGANPAFGTLTSTTGISFTTGAGSLAIDTTSGGFKLNAASTGGTLAAQNSYTVTQASQTSFALPATAAVGDTYLIASAQSNTSGWIITQGAGQEIWSNTSHTTSGATGTLAGAKSTSVVLMCVVANLEFVVIGGTAAGYTFT